MLRYILQNDEIREANEQCLSPGQVGLLAGWGVFSTLRVAGGVLFAYERHWARMKRDATLLRVPFPDNSEWMESRLLQLIEKNREPDATLRVVILRNGGGVWQGPGVEREFDLIALMNPLTDWGETIRLGIVPQARHAESPFAGVKVLSWAQNLTWYEEAHQKGFDEVVLLNERDEVSECTSANIFAVFGNLVRTPPLSSGCLPGVTRDLLLNEIRVGGIDVREHPLRVEDLERADQVFITSSTRDLRPVSFIEGLTVNSRGAVVSQLNQAFQSYISDYVTARRSLPA